MKRHLNTLNTASQKGFSLIELLIVITILGGLMAILLPAAGKALGKGTRDLNSSAQMSFLAQAVEGYYNEYGDYPASWLDTEGDLRSTADVMAPLLGRTEDDENRRDINFFNFSEGFQRDKGGMIYGSGGKTALLSPYAKNDQDASNTYVIRIDRDYDDIIPGMIKPSEQIRGRKVLIMAAGEDRDIKTRIDNVTNY